MVALLPVMAIHQATLWLVAMLGGLATVVLVDREAVLALHSAQHLPLSALSLGIASVLLIGKGDLGVDQGLVEDGVGGQGMIGSGEEVRQMILIFF